MPSLSPPRPVLTLLSHRLPSTLASHDLTDESLSCDTMRYQINRVHTKYLVQVESSSTHHPSFHSLTHKPLFSPNPPTRTPNHKHNPNKKNKYLLHSVLHASPLTAVNTSSKKSGYAAPTAPNSALPRTAGNGTSGIPISLLWTLQSSPTHTRPKYTSYHLIEHQNAYVEALLPEI